MLRPTYPGMLSNVHKNMYHLEMVLHRSQEYTWDVFKLAEPFYVYHEPLRMGIVFAAISSISWTVQVNYGVAMLNAFNLISQDKVPYEVSPSSHTCTQQTDVQSPLGYR